MSSAKWRPFVSASMSKGLQGKKPVYIFHGIYSSDISDPSKQIVMDTLEW